MQPDSCIPSRLRSEERQGASSARHFLLCMTLQAPLQMRLISAHLRGQIRLPLLRYYIFITAASREIRDDISAHPSFRRAGGCDWSGRCAGAVITASAHRRSADRGARDGCCSRCRPGLHSRRMVATHQRVATSGCRVRILKLKVSAAELHGGSGHHPAGSFTALQPRQPATLRSGRQPAAPQLILRADCSKEVQSCMASRCDTCWVLHTAQERARLCERRPHTAYTEESGSFLTG
jgi:hypothetical protein